MGLQRAVAVGVGWVGKRGEGCGKERVARPRRAARGETTTGRRREARGHGVRTPRRFIGTRGREWPGRPGRGTQGRKGNAAAVFCGREGAWPRLEEAPGVKRLGAGRGRRAAAAGRSTCRGMGLAGRRGGPRALLRPSSDAHCLAIGARRERRRAAQAAARKGVAPVSRRPGAAGAQCGGVGRVESHTSQAIHRNPGGALRARLGGPRRRGLGRGRQEGTRQSGRARERPGPPGRARACRPTRRALGGTAVHCLTLETREGRVGVRSTRRLACGKGGESGVAELKAGLESDSTLETRKTPESPLHALAAAAQWGRRPGRRRAGPAAPRGLAPRALACVATGPLGFPGGVDVRPCGATHPWYGTQQG
jgi:hypothetical protein